VGYAESPELPQEALALLATLSPLLLLLHTLLVELGDELSSRSNGGGTTRAQESECCPVGQDSSLPDRKSAAALQLALGPRDETCEIFLDRG
jgi:hypothetical protein